MCGVCTCVLDPPPKHGLYIMHNNAVLTSDSSVVITTIGAQLNQRSEAGTTLVCVTTNVNENCCRSDDGGSIGDWRGPDNVLIPRSSEASSGDVFARVGYTHQVRLSRRLDEISLLGIYTCEVPDPNGVVMTVSVTITGMTINSSLLSLTMLF